MSKKAFITGISGQDGSYLAEFLLQQGYQVHGLVRRSSLESSDTLGNLATIQNEVQLHSGSLEDHLSLYKLIASIRPDECYHLAASSFVSYSLEDEMSVISTNFHSTHYLLSSILELCPECRFYFAGSSEMFGNAPHSPQTEETPFNPRSIYGIAKLSSHHLVKNYRERQGLFACTGFTYNHESPRRGRAFVTRKVTSGAARIFLGKSKELRLGNLDAIRDWGYAPDYVRAAYAMVTIPEQAEDYVIATGRGRSVRDFVSSAFSVVGLDYREYVKEDVGFFRPTEKVPLVGDATKLCSALGWRHTKSFEDWVNEMVTADIDAETRKG